MTFLQLLPVGLSLLLLGAHAMRMGVHALSALPIALLLAILVWPRPWTARLAQVVLFLGAVEWVRATAAYIDVRRTLGAPWGRLAIILGAVALFTLLSALAFETSTLRRRYRLSRPSRC
jgi:hypothetical protein